MKDEEKSLRDFSDEEVRHWQQHPITAALRVSLRHREEICAKQTMAAITDADERFLRVQGGIYEGIRIADLIIMERAR